MQTTDDRSNRVMALLEECVNITRADGMTLATKLILMTQLEIQMQSHAIEENDLTQLCQHLEAAISDAVDGVNPY